MKPTRLAALALCAAATAPAFAATVPFTIDFEKNFGFADDVNAAYAGTPFGFQNVLGFATSALPIATPPASIGQSVASVFLDPSDAAATALLTIAGGLSTPLSFDYASTTAGWIKAYGANGELLGTLDLAANNSDGDWSHWDKATLNFSGVAYSFDLSGLNGAGLDNFSSVPEPSSALLVLASGLALAGARRRRRG
jgi:hypothetical protein